MSNTLRINDPTAFQHMVLQLFDLNGNRVMINDVNGTPDEANWYFTGPVDVVLNDARNINGQDYYQVILQEDGQQPYVFNINQQDFTNLQNAAVEAEMELPTEWPDLSTVTPAAAVQDYDGYHTVVAERTGRSAIDVTIDGETFEIHDFTGNAVLEELGFDAPTIDKIMGHDQFSEPFVAHIQEGDLNLDGLQTSPQMDPADFATPEEYNAFQMLLDSPGGLERPEIYYVSPGNYEVGDRGGILLAPVGEPNLQEKLEALGFDETDIEAIFQMQDGDPRYIQGQAAYHAQSQEPQENQELEFSAEFMDFVNNADLDNLEVTKNSNSTMVISDGENSIQISSKFAFQAQLERLGFDENDIEAIRQLQTFAPPYVKNPQEDASLTGMDQALQILAEYGFDDPEMAVLENRAIYNAAITMEDHPGETMVGNYNDGNTPVFPISDFESEAMRVALLEGHAPGRDPVLNGAHDGLATMTVYLDEEGYDNGVEVHLSLEDVNALLVENPDNEMLQNAHAGLNADLAYAGEDFDPTHLSTFSKSIITEELGILFTDDGYTTIADQRAEFETILAPFEDLSAQFQALEETNPAAAFELAERFLEQFDALDTVQFYRADIESGHALGNEVDRIDDLKWDRAGMYNFVEDYREQQLAAAVELEENRYAEFEGSHHAFDGELPSLAADVSEIAIGDTGTVLASGFNSQGIEYLAGDWRDGSELPLSERDPATPEGPGVDADTDYALNTLQDTGFRIA